MLLYFQRPLGSSQLLPKGCRGAPFQMKSYTDFRNYHYVCTSVTEINSIRYKQQKSYRFPNYSGNRGFCNIIILQKGYLKMLLWWSWLILNL